MYNNRELFIYRVKWEVLAKSVLGQFERAVEFWSPRNRCSGNSNIECSCKPGQDITRNISNGITYCQPSPGYYNSSSKWSSILAFVPCPAGTWSAFSGYGPLGQGSSMSEEVACANKCPPGTYGEKTGQPSHR